MYHIHERLSRSKSPVTHKQLIFVDKKIYKKREKKWQKFKNSFIIITNSGKSIPSERILLGLMKQNNGASTTIVT